MASEDRVHDLRIMRPTRCQLHYCHLSWGYKQHVQGLVGGQNLAYGMKGRGRNNGKGSKVKYTFFCSGVVGGQNLAYGMKGRRSNSQGRNNGKGSKVKYSKGLQLHLSTRRRHMLEHDDGTVGQMWQVRICYIGFPMLISSSSMLSDIKFIALCGSAVV